jgi:cell cycle arrest protein BUB3
MSSLKVEYELPDAPTDGISSVTFAPAAGSPLLLASSWDKRVRLYDVTVGDNAIRSSYAHNNAVLDCCFSDLNHSFSGGLDTVLTSYDFTAQKKTTLGNHEDTIKCVEYCTTLGVVITGSWDRSVKMWDPRQQQPIGTYNQSGEKVYTMSLSGERLVVGTTNKKVFVWDLRNMQFAEQRRQSSLKYQTRCIRCFPNRQGFVLGSIEGRVAVEYLDTQQEVQQKKYAFKCHRVKEDGIEKVYPVNAIAFHNIHNTFATGNEMNKLWF